MKRCTINRPRGVWLSISQRLYVTRVHGNLMSSWYRMTSGSIIVRNYAHGWYKLNPMKYDFHKNFASLKTEWNPYADEIEWNMACIFHEYGSPFYTTDTICLHPIHVEHMQVIFLTRICHLTCRIYPIIHLACSCDLIKKFVSIIKARLFGCSICILTLVNVSLFRGLYWRDSLSG